MKQTLEEAAMQELNSSYAIIVDGELAYQRQAMLNMFKKGAEYKEKQSPWISVEEQLPQLNDDLYIVIDIKMNPPGIGVCEFNLKTKSWIDEYYNFINPTHWMQIPKFNE